MAESSIHPEKDPFAWQKKAKDDLDLAREIVEKIGASDRYPAHVCFLCQQAVEKYLKALIVATGEEPSRTHDIEALVHASVPHCKHLEKFRRQLGWLTPFATEIRYPDEDEVTPGEVERALEQAEQIQKIVEAWFRSRH